MEMGWRNIINLKLPATKPFSLIQIKSNSCSFSTGSSRRRIYDGLLLDAGGTLLQLNKPVEQTYVTIANKYGLGLNESEIKQGFRRAFKAPWPKKLRYQGDGREFWRFVVFEATRCSREDYFEEAYEHYAHGDAWHLPDKAREILTLLSDAGVKMAVVSNFDNRLRRILKDLDVAHLFDAIVVSSEVGYEKPAAGIFKSALEQIGVDASKAIHIGDDEEADRGGANALGIDCWLWGSDVSTFTEIHDRILKEEEN